MHERALVRDARSRRALSMSARERLAAFGSAAAFVGAATVFLAVSDLQRDIDIPVVLLLVATFAIVSRLELEVGSGCAVPTQLVFVPMLFLVPPSIVPLLVAAGYLIGGEIDARTGRRHTTRALSLVACSWFSLPAAIAFQLAGAPDPAWSEWPLYAAAFAGYIAVDALHTALYERFAHDLAPNTVLRALARVYALDLAISPVGFLAALASRDTPLAFLALIPLAAVMALLTHERAERLNAQIEAARLDLLARTDQLTGLANRRVFDETLSRLTTREAGGELCVSLLDLDHFKEFNDRNGHPAGDALLREAARVWQLELRPGDVLCRLGGEEFGLLLPRCTLPEATAVVERLAAAVPAPQTCSAGIAAWTAGEPGDELVRRADEALYAAKHAGRARVISHSD
jgi:diguanylate cyclase (GGDEF)-like protein